ncbi:MAG: hypothetical protein AAF799_03175 [Myxococcota bacterium]
MSRSRWPPFVGFQEELDEDARLGGERWQAYAQRSADLSPDEHAYAAKRAERQPPLALLEDPLGHTTLPVLPTER